MYNERFARQYHDGLPPEFPQTSPFTGTVHHLSGPNAYAHTQTCSNRFAGDLWLYTCDYIYCALCDRYGELAHTLDSLVRVSRRAGHTYGSTHMNAVRLCMHTASVIANRAPGVILALPIWLLHEFYVKHNIHTCMSVSGWTGYTVHMCI